MEKELWHLPFPRQCLYDDVNVRTCCFDKFSFARNAWCTVNVFVVSNVRTKNIADERFGLQLTCSKLQLSWQFFFHNCLRNGHQEGVGKLLFKKLKCLVFLQSFFVVWKIALQRKCANCVFYRVIFNNTYKSHVFWALNETVFVRALYKCTNLALPNFIYTYVLSHIARDH